MGAKGVLGGIAVSTLVALSAPAVALATPAPETVSGSGTAFGYDFSLSVSAGPYGQNPTGELHVENMFDATATCINLAGNASVTGYRIENGAYLGMGFLTGPAVTASNPSPSDPTAIYMGILSAPPTACPAPGTPPPQFTEPVANRIAAMPDDESGQIVDYAVPTPGAGLSAIAPDLAAGDHGMWFTESAANQIGHISPTGIVNEYPLPTPAAGPDGIAGDARGGAWFTEPGLDRIAHISDTGTIVEHPLPTLAADPTTITADHESGGASFVEAGANSIGHVNETGAITEQPVPTAQAGIGSISASSDEQTSEVWFVEQTANQIGVLQGNGMHEIPLPPGTDPTAVAAGVDSSGTRGAWFSETGNGRLGFISDSGDISQFTVPGAQPGQLAITSPLGVPALSGYANSDGVWWTDRANSAIGLARIPIVPSSVSSEGGGSGHSVPGGRKSFGKVRPLLTLLRRVGHHGWAVSFTVRCGPRVRCHGRAQLLTVKSHGLRARRPLGKTQFAVRAGHRRTLRVTVDRPGRRLIAGLGDRITVLLVLHPRQGPSLVRRVKLRPHSGR